MMQKGSAGFKPAPLLKALRAAAVMALPPKPVPAPAAAASEGSEETSGTEQESTEEAKAVRAQKFGGLLTLNPKP